MKKNKKGAVAKKEGLLGGARKVLKKIGQDYSLRRLSTAQKVVGGISIVAMGIGYLVKQRGTLLPLESHPTNAAERQLTALEVEDN